MISSNNKDITYAIIIIAMPLLLLYMVNGCKGRNEIIIIEILAVHT